MQITTFFNRLGRNDFRLIRRDSFLVMMVVYMLIIAAALRVGIPALAETLLANNGFDLSVYYPLITTYVGLVLGGLLIGVLFGFLLLDERDDHTLTALLVTPLSLRTFIGYRVGVAAVLGFLMNLAVILILDLVTLPVLPLVLAAAISGLYAPIMMLFCATFAANKVEGFALMKVASTISMIPVGAYFLPEPWQYVAGLFPPFWPCKALWQVAAGNGGWPFLLALGLGAMLVALGWFVRRFEQIAYR